MTQGILAILGVVLLALREFFKRKEAKDAQKEADLINRNPTEWFSTHFGVQSDSSTASKSDATETGTDQHHGK